MSKWILLVLMSLFSVFSHAQNANNFGIGVILGSPTALSGKYFMSNTDAVDMGLSFSDRYTMVFGDYLKHFPGVFGKQNAFVARLTPYVGVGPLLVFDNDDDDNHKNHHRDYFDDEDDDFAVGARIPLGIEWMAPQIPIGVALELVPGVVVLPHTDGFLQAGLAVRYYF